MDSVSDIRVELSFLESSRFPAQIVLGTIEAVSRAVDRVEAEDIEALSDAFADEIPAAVFDAMRYRSRQYHNRSLSFDDASSGSVVLIGMAAGLAYWLLDKTLGETVNQAWKESELHTRIKEFLLTRFDDKAERIASKIRPSRWRGSDRHVRARVVLQDERPVIKVEARVPEDMSALPLEDGGGRGNS